MTNETGQKEKTPLAKQAALASVLAPVIAVSLSVMTSSAIREVRLGKLVVGMIGSLLIIAGFVCALIGLAGIRKYGKKGILGRSLAGLLINGFAIVAAVFALYMMGRIAKHGTQPRFTVSLPAAFLDFPAGMQAPDVLHSYIKGDPADYVPDIICLIESLGGPINKADDFRSAAASHPNVSYLKEDWKGHRIDVFRIEGNEEGLRVLTFNAQVPLLPKAIQVKLVGLMEREEELRQDLHTILAGIDGSSNW